MQEDTDFTRNNLDRAFSPYLRQHKDNPIHWQEWKREVLDYARKQKKLIFVSVGYSTCHWCHVMAEETFSDLQTADFLNEHFVSIKVDREQRPDIDTYFMDFLVATQGNGGWPMNVFLTPDGKPFFAGTYFPTESSMGRLGFKQVLEQVLNWYRENLSQIKLFKPVKVKGSQINEKSLIQVIKDQFDGAYGGWGEGPKFPPYNTLIFLMNYLAENPGSEIKEMITFTLNQMVKSGLYDHLQGGFFRYCVDRKWRIPHFEKMLYDQAMMLWTYSLGFKLFKENLYKNIVFGIAGYLEDVFADDDLYYSALDADTDHKEGATYLWTEDELKKILSWEEWQNFTRVYDLSGENHLEGNLHLVKKTADFLPDIEHKLLGVRSKRPQPEKDKKIITAWNALLGIAFLVAGRYLGSDVLRSKGIGLYQILLGKHWDGEKLVHSLLDNQLQKQSFLEDYAAVLLLSTYIHEETFGEKSTILKLKQKVLEFFKGGSWMESLGGMDFQSVYASEFDYPTPSSISLAEEALRRVALILGESDKRLISYKAPVSGDFYNLAVFYKLGNFHEIHAPESLNYSDLPPNSMFLKGEKYQDCYQMKCQRFESKKALLEALKS